MPRPGRAADEQRVVREAGHLGDGERGGVGEPVGVADDELLERVARVEAPAARGVAGVAPGRARRGASSPGRDELDRRRRARARRRRSAWRSRPKRCADPGADRVGRLDDAATPSRRPRPRAARATGARSTPARPAAARRGSGARQAGCSSSITGARKILLAGRGGRRLVERGARNGPGTANIARARRPRREASRSRARKSRGKGGEAAARGLRAVHGVCDACARACARSVGARQPRRRALRRAVVGYPVGPLRAPGAPTLYGL